MPVDELNQLRNMVRNKINMDAFADRVGVYDSPDARFYQDLLSYVDKTLTSQRSALKGYNDNKQGKSAKFDKREQSKNSKAKEFAAKESAVDFQPGDRVTLSRVKHEEFRGQQGTVRRYIKSRNVVEIKLDDGKLYDSYPENLDKIRV